MFTLSRCDKECILENAIYVDIVYAATPRLNTKRQRRYRENVDWLLSRFLTLCILVFSMVASEVSTSSLLCLHRFKKRWREEKGERREGEGGEEGRRVVDGGRGMEGGGREEGRRWGLLTLCISVFSFYL